MGMGMEMVGVSSLTLPQRRRSSVRACVCGQFAQIDKQTNKKPHHKKQTLKNSSKQVVVLN